MAFFARSVDSPRIAFAAIALSFLTVVLPSILEVWMRIAAGRQRTGLVVRLAKIRAFLMPGAGLEQQTRALYALELQDSEGCDAALLYLKKCARELDEPYALALVHEQILSNLVALERYD